MLYTPPKHKWQLASTLDTWLENDRMLGPMSGAYRLLPICNLEAVRHRMTGQRSMIRFEQVEGNARIIARATHERAQFMLS